jgi:hypothetical protein
MRFRKTVARGAIVGALGFSALGLGVGLGTASADPWQPCWAQNCQGDQRGDGGQDHRGDGGDGRQWGDQWRPDQWRPDQWRPDQGGWDQRPWDQRGIDDARGDHQPFNWQGQRVDPYWDQDRGAWGFWFFGLWIPL